MYRGLRQQTQKQASTIATRQQPYRMVNRVHSVRVNGLQGEGIEYFGPPRAGQSWSQFQEYMSMQNLAIGGAIATLAVINPIIGLSIAASWMISGGPQKKTTGKAGGY